MASRQNLKLISFDGGGIRSLSQLEIMRTIMHQLNWNKESGTKLPYECFDLMGGSGTGGLVAMMLARLRMSVDDALNEFFIIVEQVYNQESISPSERTARLKTCLEDMMNRGNHPLDMKLTEETGLGACQCFVTTSLRINASTTVCLRSYPVQSSPLSPITVIDAALATCATQPQFAPIFSGQGFRKKEYIGAGIGASNPIHELFTEAQSLFGGDANVASMLSLGNGHPGIITLSSNDAEFGSANMIWDLMNDCTQKAHDIEQRIGSTGIYSRFSVEQGMQNEHSATIDPSWIISQTESYLGDARTENRLKTFVQKFDAPIQGITLDQLWAGNVPDVSIQLPPDLEKKQLNVVVFHPDDTIIQKLKPANLEYSSHVTECMDGTRQDILESVYSWIEDLNAPNILWLKGYPGVGKSAIATSVVEKLRSLRRLGSAFFFQRERSNDMTPHALWRVVAYSLGRQYPLVREKLMAALNDDETLPSGVNIDNLFLHLIQEPLMASENARTSLSPVVVVDALDECGGLDGQYSKHRRQLLQTLRSWSHLPNRFKLFVTGRGESDIERFFAGTPHRLIDVLAGQLVKEESSLDIKQFLELRFRQIASQYPSSLSSDWPGHLIIEELTNKAAGVFIWVEVITSFAERGNPKEQLKKILSGGGTGNMAHLYSLILNTSFPDPSETVIKCFRSLLGTVILAKSPLPISSIAEFLSLDETEMEHICNGLRTVLGSTDTLRIYHQSFVDFLIDENKCPAAFLIDRKRESRALTIACLRTMKHKLRFNICNFESSYLLNGDVTDLATRIHQQIYPNLLYSSFFWATHLSTTPFEPEILEHLQFFMNDQFLYWLEVLSVTKKVNIASGALWLLIDWICAGGQDEVMARDMQKFVATFGSIISQSLPHIYLSALPFAPQTSSLFINYIRNYPGVLVVRMGGHRDWAATQNIMWGHYGTVLSVSFSPDGKRIASGSYDDTIRVWDAETGEAIAGPWRGHEGGVNSVSFSLDGTRIISGSNDGTIRVWDIEKEEMIIGPLKGHTHHVNSISFSPNEKRIASGSDDKTIRLWDSETGDMVVEPLKGHTGDIYSVAFSPDGKRVVSGSEDKTIRIWDAETGHLLVKPLEGHRGSIASVVFSPEGTRIISGSYDGSVLTWDAKSGVIVTKLFEDRQAAVKCLATSPDGKRIAFGCSDANVRMWDAETDEIIVIRLEMHNSTVWDISFSPDGRRIAGAVNTTIQVWDAETIDVAGEPSEGHSDWVGSVAFSPDGSQIVSGSDDGTIKVWNTETGEMIAGPVDCHDSKVHSVTLSPDGKQIASSSEDGTIRIWNAETGEVVAGPLKRCRRRVHSASFSPNGREIISVSDDMTIKVWDIRTEDVIAEPFLGDLDIVHSIAFSFNLNQMVSGSSDGTIRVWDVKTGEILAGPTKGHEECITSVAFSPDGTRIASGSVDKTIRIWNTKTGEVLVGPMNGHDDDVFAVAFSPSGRKVVSGSRDKTLRVWDAETGELVAGPLEGHEDSIHSVVFSPDGGRVVSGSDDKTIRIWDGETGEAVIRPLEGHNGRVNCVSFSPDGNRIISGSNDETIRVWDAKTGQSIEWSQNGRHKSGITAASFSPDGKSVASASPDMTIEVRNAEDGASMQCTRKGSRHVHAILFSPDGKELIYVTDDMNVHVQTLGTHQEVIGPWAWRDDWVRPVAFALDGKQIASYSYRGGINIWNIETRKVFTIPRKEYKEVIRCVAFSPDGKRVVSGSADNTIRIWDIKIGEMVVGPLEGHKEDINSVAFSPDGRHIASGSNDATIRVWDAHTGKIILEPLKGNQGGIKSIAFSPDGRSVTSGDTTATIRVWDVTTTDSNDPTPVSSYFSDSSEMEDGWVLGPNSERLFWVPYELRAGLYWPRNTCIMGKFPKTQLDMTAFVHGESWTQCRG